MTEYGIYLGIASLALALIVHAVRVTWQVRGMEGDIRSFMDAQIDNLQRDIAATQVAHSKRADVIGHDAGEMGAALRAKIHEIEVFSRDTFVRKDSFERVVGQLQTSIEKLGDRVEEKLEKFWERTQRS